MSKGISRVRVPIVGVSKVLLRGRVLERDTEGGDKGGLKGGGPGGDPEGGPEGEVRKGVPKGVRKVSQIFHSLID